MKTSQIIKALKLTSTCLLLFFISISTIAQTKKEILFSLDTLKRSHRALQRDFISVKEAWKKHNIFFEHVKSEFFLPIDINTSIDEGVIKFDEISTTIQDEIKNLTKTNASLKDSLKLFVDSLQYYESIIEEMKNKSMAYNNIILSSLKKASFPQSKSEFVGNWDLFLDLVQLNGEPFESGIVGFNPFTPNDSLSAHNIYKIEFTEDEIATLYFRGGKEQKSFYSVKNFSSNSPYTVQFAKNDEFKLTMLISPLPTGLTISYEVPVKTEKVFYYYGLMKR